jgi:hypothetical protein
MATTITDILDTVGLAGQVYTITNDWKSAGIAAGYAAFVRSIAGSTPLVSRISATQAKVYLTKEQADSVRTYIATSIKKSKESLLDIDLSPVYAPAAITWGAIAAIVAGVGGYLLAKM